MAALGPRLFGHAGPKYTFEQFDTLFRELGFSWSLRQVFNIAVRQLGDKETKTLDLSTLRSSGIAANIGTDIISNGAFNEEALERFLAQAPHSDRFSVEDFSRGLAWIKARYPEATRLDVFRQALEFALISSVFGQASGEISKASLEAVYRGVLPQGWSPRADGERPRASVVGLLAGTAKILWGRNRVEAVYAGTDAALNLPSRMDAARAGAEASGCPRR
ncbi:MAG: hypothetical protein AAFX94_00495 [Myxococcota bacterium]